MWEGFPFNPPLTASLRMSALTKEGDCALLFFSGSEAAMLLLKKSDEFHNHFGHFLHARCVGVPWGSRVFSVAGSSYGTILPFTPDRWTDTLVHRTQIMYTPDISCVLAGLDIRRGSVVVESGTGSGSLTVAMASTVRPEGHIHTFEFHAGRVAAALADFERLALLEHITVTHRNVLKDGFHDIENESVDAVFLDLPRIEDAIPEAIRILKVGSRVACLTPCMEQCYDLASACRRLPNCVQISTMEVSMRYWDMRMQNNYNIPEAWKTSMPHVFGGERFAMSTTKLAGTQKAHTAFLTFITKGSFQ